MPGLAAVGLGQLADGLVGRVAHGERRQRRGVWMIGQDDALLLAAAARRGGGRG